MLEHHYWIKDSFLEKIGRMTPNILELSLRRIKISNKAFTLIVKEIKKLLRIDISDCPNILESSMKILLDNNLKLQQIQASNIPRAIDDEVVRKITLLEGLKFLDISYASEVTDEGMIHFKDKLFPITKLILSGLTGITSAGLSYAISTC